MALISPLDITGNILANSYHPFCLDKKWRGVKKKRPNLIIGIFDEYENMDPEEIHIITCVTFKIY